MVTLVSPGVDVEIIDQSFYGSGGAGTIPLILVATQANKIAVDNSGTAAMTVPSQANVLFLATSQRDLLINYGNPVFTTFEGTGVNGDELSEYGLHAAYSYLGIASTCYVLRADIDLAQLAASETPPAGPPANGTYWLNLNSTTWGVFQSNGAALAGNAWVSQTVLVPTAANTTAGSGAYTGITVPSDSYGAVGNFAIVTETTNNYLFEMMAPLSGNHPDANSDNPTWYLVGSANWLAQRPTVVVGSANPAPLTTPAAFSINGHTVTISSGSPTVTDVRDAINTAAVTNITASTTGSNALQLSNSAGTAITLANVTGTPLATLGFTVGNTQGTQLVITSTEVLGANNVPVINPSYPSGTAAGSVWIRGNPSARGANWVFEVYNSATAQWSLVSAPFYQITLLDGDNQPYPDTDVHKDAQARSILGNNPTPGTLYVGWSSSGTLTPRIWTGSQWNNLVYEASIAAPSTSPADGTFWHNNQFQVDVMVNQSGENWVGYRYFYPQTDPGGVIIAGSPPLFQSDGTALVDNDLWIDSTDLENYPALHRYSASTSQWSLVDITDHVSPFGIVFADARADAGPTFTGIPNANDYTFGSTKPVDLTLSAYVDPDAPNAQAFPAGLMLFNTRLSTGNIKVWRAGYFTAGSQPESFQNTDFTLNSYTVGGTSFQFPVLSDPGRWVSASGNTVDTGVPYMLRKAQRRMVVEAMRASADNNQEIRSELVFFNLLACPGYPELLESMNNLNVDDKQVSFIVGDTPIRLAPTGTAIQNWANNVADVAETGEDGLTISSDYIGLYYPWGLGQDSFGNSVMVPPSTIALRVMAYNDQVAYPWFAPAGFHRGLVTNANSVGYLNSAGEYVPTILNQGQRDVLYTNKINPIAYIPGRGLVVYGQKTLDPLASALDRVNVARLANYIAYNLDLVVKPFLFEQNDVITRASAQATVARFFNALVGLRGIYDYAVVCDTSNNTPERIDANELWIDCAIQPVKTVEFIYVPVRVLNTGANINQTSNWLPNNATTTSITSVN